MVSYFLLLHFTDVVTYEECITDENDLIENSMFDPTSGTFTSTSTNPSIFSFSATSLLKSEYNAPVYIQLIKNKVEGNEKVVYMFQFIITMTYFIKN